MSTSLAWSSGRVSLLVHCSVPSVGDRLHPSRRKLSCDCTLPGFSSSVTTSILRSGSETGSGKSTTVVSVSGGGDSTVEPHGRFVVPGYRRSALESVFSLVVALVMTVGVQGAPSSQDTFEDVPQTLSGGEKGHRIQKPKSGKAESCTRKCVPTCVRGGAGAPGEGPLNVERPLVVFKEGFRSRQYCLIECSEVCNLIGDGSSLVPNPSFSMTIFGRKG